MSRPPSTTDALLAWYDRARRDLPWRAAAGVQSDPYVVWLSEIMLQQTTVAAVTPRFQRFLARWPTVVDLASAADEDVMAEWAGLGYYARARNLLKCARAVAARPDRAFPDDEAGLKALPGIGDYTAAAVAAIAFNRLATPVDGNIERVAARLFRIETPLPGAKSAIKQAASTLTPADRPGDFAQAAMDLGATICLPKRPRCLACPLRGHCKAHVAGVQEALPAKAPKRAKPLRRGDVYWAERDDGRVLLRRRAARGLLGGMAELPSYGWSDDDAPAMVRRLTRWTVAPPPVVHVFTHFRLELTLHRGRVMDHADYGAPDLFWAEVDRLAEIGLPSVMAKVAKAALTRDQA